MSFKMTTRFQCTHYYAPRTTHKKRDLTQKKSCPLSQFVCPASSHLCQFLLCNNSLFRPPPVYPATSLCIVPARAMMLAPSIAVPATPAAAVDVPNGRAALSPPGLPFRPRNQGRHNTGKRSYLSMEGPHYLVTRRKPMAGDETLASAGPTMIAKAGPLSSSSSLPENVYFPLLLLREEESSDDHPQEISGRSQNPSPSARRFSLKPRHSDTEQRRQQARNRRRGTTTAANFAATSSESEPPFLIDCGY